MYKKPNYRSTKLIVNNSSEGESIEMKVQRIVNNKEPIKDGAPIIYTERKEGVKAGYNIRTDRFDVALDATDIIQKSVTAKREQMGKVVELNPTEKGSNQGNPESTQGTNN